MFYVYMLWTFYVRFTYTYSYLGMLQDVRYYPDLVLGNVKIYLGNNLLLK